MGIDDKRKGYILPPALVFAWSLVSCGSHHNAAGATTVIHADGPNIHQDLLLWHSKTSDNEEQVRLSLECPSLQGGWRGVIVIPRSSSRAYWSAGSVVSGCDDIDGDGHGDLVVRSPHDATTGPNAGAVRLISGNSGSVLMSAHGTADDEGLGREAVVITEAANGSEALLLTYSERLERNSGGSYLVKAFAICSDGSAVTNVVSSAELAIPVRGLAACRNENGDANSSVLAIAPEYGVGQLFSAQTLVPIKQIRIIEGVRVNVMPSTGGSHGAFAVRARDDTVRLYWLDNIGEAPSIRMAATAVWENIQTSHLGASVRALVVTESKVLVRTYAVESPGCPVIDEIEIKAPHGVRDADVRMVISAYNEYTVFYFNRISSRGLRSSVVAGDILIYDRHGQCVRRIAPASL